MKVPYLESVACSDSRVNCIFAVKKQALGINQGYILLRAKLNGVSDRYMSTATVQRFRYLVFLPHPYHGKTPAAESQ